MILGNKSYFTKVNFQESRIKLKIIFRNLTSFHKIKFYVYLFIYLFIYLFFLARKASHGSKAVKAYLLNKDQD